MRQEINIETLRELLECDFKTGLLSWKPRPEEMFPEPWMARSWNTRFAGRPALSCVGRSGYMHGAICGRSVSAHRVVFALANGYLPEIVDHRNGCKTDNRPENLRDASPKINSRNMKLSSANKSGVCGVYWRRDVRMWQAQIGGGKTKVFLGLHRNLSDAVEARKRAELQHNFDMMHGKTSTTRALRPL